MLEQNNIFKDKDLQYTSMEGLLQVLKFSEIQQQEIKKYNISLSESGISWVFKLSERINAQLSKNDNFELDYFADLVDIQYKLLVFILEDSNYLDPFPNKDSIRLNCEQELREIFYVKEALELIETDRDTIYISEVARKLITSGYIFDREHKIAVLEILYRYSRNLLTLPVEDYIRLINIFEGIIPKTLLISIAKRFEKEQEEVNHAFHYNVRNSEIQKKGEDTLRLLCAYILLDRSNSDMLSRVIHRITFYRYLYILSNYKHDILRDKALELLIHLNTSSRNEYNWSDVLDFSLPEFIKKIISSLSTVQEGDGKKGIFKRQGQIEFDNSLITCFPNHLTRLGLLQSDFFNTRLIVTSQNASIDINDNIDSLVFNWRSIIDEYASRPQENMVMEKERPGVGTMVKIQVKNLHPTNPLFAFVRIVDDRYKGEGVLHVKEITRVKLQTLEGIINAGDIMSAEVIESTPERLSFSIIDELDLFVGARFHKDEVTHAKLLSKRENLLTWVSEDGYTLYNGPSSNFEVAIGDCYVLKLTDVNYNGYIKAKILEKSDIEIDNHEAVANLVYHYKDMETCVEIEEDNNPEFILPDIVISELEYVLDTYANSSRGVYKTINYLYLNKLVNVISGNQDANEYHSILIDYHLSLYKFAKGENLSGNCISEDMIAKYPVLREKKISLSILSYDGEEHNSELLEITSTSTSHDNIMLAKLMLFFNLSKTLKPDFASRVKSDIFSLLSLETEDIVEEEHQEPVMTIDFGIENNNREFKTSIVFSNKNGVANLDYQLEVILRTICGFLNAQGGTLYIGINDDGVPIGIEEDLQFMHCNEDTYQLKIRQYVVENLGKDINSLLTFSFRKYGSKTVCAIAVPSYHMVVKLHNTVYQRQGNATRPLESKNVKLLIQRKKGNGLTNKAPYPLFPEDPNYYSNQDRIFSGNENALDKIPTSLFHSYSLHKGYFSIIENNKYILTEGLPGQFDTRLTLPIPEDLSNSSLLFVYNNGYATRVPANILSNKKFDFEYQNALNQDFAIRFIAFVQDQDYLLLSSELKKEEYSKIMPVKQIKKGTELALKGSPILPHFDHMILVEVLTPEQVLNLQIDDNINSLGSPATALDTLHDRLYIKKLLGI